MAVTSAEDTPEVGPAWPDSARALARLIDVATVKLAATSLGLASDGDVLDVVTTMETMRRRLDGVLAALVVEVSDRELFRVSGHTTVKRFYAQELRLGAGEAKRRLEVAESIAPMMAMTGQKLPPKREALADAVAQGKISAEHIHEIEAIMAAVPHSASVEEVETAVTIMAEAAKEMAPAELRPVGQRLLGHLDPDGELSDDTDRRRQRGVTIGRQDSQLLSKLSGVLTPALRAKIEVILHSWAAPGINNPDDEKPIAALADDAGTDGREQLAEAVSRDTRSPAQRNHDALETMCDWILGHQGLGRPDRIPAQLVITIDEHDLAARAGASLTSTGTLVPTVDLVELAADAVPWLVVFQHASRVIVDFARGRRIASFAQRLALFGKDRGCTRPGCTEPFSRTQAHHAQLDFAKGGLTNLADLGSACGPDNRNVGTGPGQWDTAIIDGGPDAGRTGWRRAGTGRPFRANPVHHPQAFLHSADPGPLGETSQLEAPQRDRGIELRRYIDSEHHGQSPPSLVEAALHVVLQSVA
ncbi:HNH endonuclease signature motif containing protein [Gordonia defluvii]|uniref:HNH endonuclease signature motif containing protein n=1 Tax=Gordonia defluvii TaxID=283718 RepID=A0ABP6L4H4_9ACTN|nr:HNH endonuclease signature motif containing protein [Gordonia sp. UBA5067]